MIWDFKKYPYYLAETRQVYPDIKPGMPFLSKCSIIGNLVFVSGLNGMNLKTGSFSSIQFEHQLVNCLDNIRTALEEAGSSVSNMIKLLVFIRNIGDCPDMWRIMTDYFSKYASNLLREPPAITVIPVNAFFEIDCQIVIDALAVLDQKVPGWEVGRFPNQHPAITHTYGNVSPDLPLFAESVAVGNLLFLSGIGGENTETGRIETGNFEAQMDIGFEKIRVAFERAGSSVNNIIKTLHLLTGVDSILSPSYDNGVSHSPASDRLWKRELEHYEKYAPYLLEEFPASTFLKLNSLETPGSMAAIDITGVLSLYRPGWEVRKYPLYYGKRGFPRHIGEIKKYYANTVVVGNIIFISGQTPTDQTTGRIEKDTFEEQVMVTLENLRTAIEETGNSLSNLAKTYILLPDVGNYSVMKRLELEYYQKYAPNLVNEPPASTLICPLNLASPKMMIEIEAIGFAPGN